MSIYEYPNAELPVAELKLGDVVRVTDGPFGTAIVQKVTETDVTFFRPYGANHDFSYTGGIICLTGTETYSVSRKGTTKWYVYQRQEIR